MGMGTARSNNVVRDKTLTSILERNGDVGNEGEGKGYTPSHSWDLPGRNGRTDRGTNRIVDSTWCNTLFVTKSILFRRITSAHATCLCGSARVSS
jgi:hypothetical protein